MKILSLNSGSSSIKYRLFDSGNQFQLLKQGAIERISYHRKAMKTLFPGGLHDIDAAGHRIVHGGERFREPVIVNNEIITELAKLAQFAPLHCEPNIAGIVALQEMLPNIPHVAVFDTATHASMEPKSYLYGIPFEYYEKYKIRKYGFHGINHAYVASEAARLLNRPLEELKVITCHLGNGCSINAFSNGKSIDNSMGFTPLEGLVMGTRCGDIDPSVVFYLLENLGWQVDQVRELLNKKSGLLGLCGKNDMRDIIALYDKNDHHAQIAIDIFVYRIQKYIGAYVAALNGLDALVFTGGIGENSPLIRSLIVKNLTYLGIQLDSGKNTQNAPIFSAPASHPVLLTIPANEELSIAKQVSELLF